MKIKYKKRQENFQEVKDASLQNKGRDHTIKEETHYQETVP